MVLILFLIIFNPLNFNSKFSDGSKKTQIYDLEEIERLDPTNDIKDYMTFKKKDGEETEYLELSVEISHGSCPRHILH